MFSSDKNIETLSQLYEQVKDYLLLQRDYMKLEMIEKLTILASGIILTTICITLGMMALFYLSFCLAYFIAPHVRGGLIVSYGIITVALLVLMWLVYLFRKPLIVKPLVKFIGNLFTDKNAASTDESSKE